MTPRWPLLIGAVILFLCGCAVITPHEAPDSGFLPHGDKLKKMTERAPFHGVWYADQQKLDAMSREYHNLYVMPVDTRFLQTKLRAYDAPDGWKRMRLEDLSEIGKYMEVQIKRAINEYPKHPLKIAEEVGPKTFVLEFAIVELNPTSPAVNTIGSVLGFLVPGGGLIRVAGTGSIAIEGVLRDYTGESLFEVRDRKSDKVSAVSIKDYQQYAHCREAIDDWAKALAELAATTSAHRVEGAPDYTLNPF